MRVTLRGVALAIAGVLMMPASTLTHHGSASSRGFRRTTFKPGEQVTVTLTPVKSGAPVGRVRTVVLANGQKL
jgi:hypothetical protein